ncbi:MULTISPECIES: hypothetical protein [Methylobacterium]|nr:MULTISPECIES: hypothetical protein [Methylobacterium]GBU20016.1 hypothetical protein AwMethylo_42310 [Methylobacterium sp.]
MHALVASGNWRLYKLSYNEELIYEFTCDHGHENLIVVQKEKFEVLFQIASLAYLDGYFREAVVTFTSALERFYEFFIQVMYVESGRDEAQFLEAWKSVKSSSERQIGAYALIHALTLGSPAQILSSAQVSFRNKVVHQGHIPSDQEAYSYGNSILILMRDKLTFLREKYNISFDKVVSKKADLTRVVQKYQRIPASLSDDTIIGCGSYPIAPESLRAGLDMLQSYRAFAQRAPLKGVRHT